MGSLLSTDAVDSALLCSRLRWSHGTQLDEGRPRGARRGRATWVAGAERSPLDLATAALGVGQVRPTSQEKHTHTHTHRAQLGIMTCLPDRRSPSSKGTFIPAGGGLRCVCLQPGRLCRRRWSTLGVARLHTGPGTLRQRSARPKENHGHWPGH